MFLVAGGNPYGKAAEVLPEGRLHCGLASHRQCLCHQDCGHQVMARANCIMCLLLAVKLPALLVWPL